MKFRNCIKNCPRKVIHGFSIRSQYSCLGRYLHASPVCLDRRLTRKQNKEAVLNEAQKAYGKMPQWNVVAWTSVISELAKAGLSEHALAYFLQMRRVGIEPNEFTLSTVVGICSRYGMIDFVIGMHCLLIKVGLSCQEFISSGLIAMYAKQSDVQEAQQVFDERPRKDLVSLSSLITAYVQNDLGEKAVHLFSCICTSWSERTFLVNHFTVASVLKACANLGCIRICKGIHTYVIKLNLELDVVAAASMVDMYSKCGDLDRARRVFDQMSGQDLIAWNVMITGYAQNNCLEETIELLYQMQSEGFIPNQTTFTTILRAVSELGNCILGRYCHAKITKLGCFSDAFVETALVDMYAKSSHLEDAEKAFSEMPTKNLVSLNAMISGYSLGGRYKEALKVYTIFEEENLRPDSLTFLALISACSQVGAQFEGAQVHAQSMKLGLDSHASVANALVNLYSKYQQIDKAFKAFETVRFPTLVSWAGMISGYAQNGEGVEALRCFCTMLQLSQKPDEFSVTLVLKVIANWASVEQGKHVHAYVTKTCRELDLFVGTAFVDMYSKCGVPQDSYKIFNDMPEKNDATWNSMILGFAHNGFSGKALQLFDEMVKSGFHPTCATFTAVLSACSHAGLVAEGRCYFDLMRSVHEISPSVEHYTCLVHLLGHAGHLQEAEALIKKSPFSSDPVIWRTLLAACKLHRDINVGVPAAETAFKLEPQVSASYVILSNIYASEQSWYEVSKLRSIMKECEIEKQVGCSWIQVKNTMKVFIADSKAPFAKDEKVLLGKLFLQMKSDYNSTV